MSYYYKFLSAGCFPSNIPFTWSVLQYSCYSEIWQLTAQRYPFRELPLAEMEILQLLLVWMCSPEIHVLKSQHDVVVLESESFRWCLGSEGKALMSGFSACIKETPENFLSTVSGGRWEVCNSEEIPHLAILILWSWTSSLQTVGNKLLLISYLINGILL